MSKKIISQNNSQSKPKAVSLDAQTKVSQSDQLPAQILDLQSELAEAQAKAIRAVADYQNLLRRTQEERSKLVKLVAIEVMESLLLPIEHLNLVAQQSPDPGVKMAIDELKQALQKQGLEEIQVMGKEFDVEQMEVVERSGEGNQVTQVVKPGYTLFGQVIQHAKVIVG
ncbi:MAG: nucleotide exchange factor GrpE [Patescibacteria group bacterium]|nr:nucleotide exchange factor GrpE [Patescibacteria group bacterium]